MEIEDYKLRQMLNDASEMGAKKALIDAGLDKPFLKKAEAFKLYGRSTVERWIKEGLIKPSKDGGQTTTTRLDKMRLALLSKTSNRNTYLTQKEQLTK